MQKEAILDRLTMRDVLEYYAPRKIVKDRCSCPIHNGKGLNFSIYENSFYCWVCHAAGDLIKFVSLYCDIDYGAAIVRLNYDFNLGFNLSLNKKMSYREQEQARKILRQKRIEQEIEEQQKQYTQSAYIKLCEYHRWLIGQKKTEAVIHDTEFMGRLLDKYLDSETVILFDIDALLDALKTKHIIGGAVDT